MTYNQPTPPHAAPSPLRTAKVRFSGVATSAMALPAPAASVWRGQFGRRLREATGDAPGSVYRTVFATPAAAVTLPDLSSRARATLGLTGPHRPHPFILRVPDAPDATPLTVAAGDQVAMELVLIESAVGHLPAVCSALEAVWNAPLGAPTAQPGGRTARGRAVLQQATLKTGALQWDLLDGGRWQFPPLEGPLLYDRAAALQPQPASTEPPLTPGALRVILRAPLRAKHRGAWVRPPDVTPAVLSAQLLRRLGALNACYGRTPLTDAMVTAWRNTGYDMADATTLVQQSLDWTDTFRYSARQERSVPAGGVTGAFVLKAPTPWLRQWHYLLQQAAMVHLGKGTAFGHGALRVEAAAA